MRRLELTWDTGVWAPGIAEMIADEILAALDDPKLSGSAWPTPDSIRVVSGDDPIKVTPQGDTE